jgi:hypothetical protein
LPTVNEQNVADIAMRIFQFQAQHNPVYALYLQHLGCDNTKITQLIDIPFLPISFFKRHRLITGGWREEGYFSSSGMTGVATSTHFIEDLAFYHVHAEQCFINCFGPLNQYHILALMPSYLERKNSSLISMISDFIRKSQSEYSGFYLYNQEDLLKDIRHLQSNTSRKVILWGVSFALLDFAEKFQPDLNNCFIFETGGMKGRRTEITREELHKRLKKYFNVNHVYSEYGMTELLSQAYTRGDNIFYPLPWMKVITREATDPFEKGFFNRYGGLNVIDLANIHSVAFIETEDMGKVFPDGSFEVGGRFDNSDIRGCNLMVE